MTIRSEGWGGVYALAILAGVLLATPALADPCTAIPDKGPTPAWVKPYLKRGAEFTGPVVYVGDGDGLCVSLGLFEHQWIEVRLQDFYAPEISEPGGPEAKDMLERIAKGRTVTCVSRHRSYDRIVATCTLWGVSLGERMRKNGVVEGGKGR